MGGRLRNEVGTTGVARRCVAAVHQLLHRWLAGPTVGGFCTRLHKGLFSGCGTIISTRRPPCSEVSQPSLRR